MRFSIVLSLIILLSSCGSGRGGSDLFTTYEDAGKLQKDAALLVDDFSKYLNSHTASVPLAPKVVVKTTPSLIFYNSIENTVTVPLWKDTGQDVKQLFYELAGSEEEGKRFFGYFFNGFYIAHEFGHGIQAINGKTIRDNYAQEMDANNLAILYYRHAGMDKQLRDCYKAAKKMIGKLPDPVPPGNDPHAWFNENAYYISDPSIYGYFQFRQFVDAYENTGLTTLSDYIDEVLLTR